jgi:hypothetical protein
LITTGKALIGETPVADVELHEEWVQNVLEVPIPGRAGFGHKDLSHRGPAHIRFEHIDDQRLELQVERLLDFADGDLEQKRTIRDVGGRTFPLDLMLDDGRSISGARVAAPPSWDAPTESTLFPIALPG